MKKLVLIGAGGHCRSCIDVIKQANTHKIIAILGQPQELNNRILDLIINGTDDDIDAYAEQGCEFLITIGQIKSVESRVRIFQHLKKIQAQLATIISPLAYVSDYARVADGTIVMHNAQINASARVDQNCIINSKALIEHDAVVEKHCHISTAATINGGVRVGEQSFVGSHATGKQGASIHAHSFIKAGSVYQ